MLIMIASFTLLSVAAIGGLYLFSQAPEENLGISTNIAVPPSPTTSTVSDSTTAPPSVLGATTPEVIGTSTSDSAVGNDPTDSAGNTGTTGTAGSTTTAQPVATPQAAAHSIDLSMLYSLINAHRKENKLTALRVHASLEQSATRKLQEMIATKYWTHQNQQGVINWQVLKQSGYHYELAGENLSFGNNSEWSIFSAWVASPEHNKQLLTPEYEDMGASVDCLTYQEAGEAKCMAVIHLGKQQY